MIHAVINTIFNCKVVLVNVTENSISLYTLFTVVFVNVKLDNNQYLDLLLLILIKQLIHYVIPYVYLYIIIILSSNYSAVCTKSS